MDMMTILRMFATPLGGLVNKGLAVGSASALTWLISKGVPATDAGSLVSAAALFLSTGITMLARTQGVQIDRINSATNGVVVVPEADAAAKGVQPVNGPLH
jgi:hypothetical protein